MKTKDMDSNLDINNRLSVQKSEHKSNKLKSLGRNIFLKSHKKRSAVHESPCNKRAAPRDKRSGLVAVKLHLEATGGTGRTSRSATTVRKTSIRMTAIKEYPFDLSDLKKEEHDGTNNTSSPQDHNSGKKDEDGKRRVSIMTEKDREGVTHSERNGRISGQLDGPSRRKSNLHNAMASELDSSWDRPAHIEGRFKKQSTTSSAYSKKALSQQSEHVERSWWYACCQKCHQDDSGIPSWEPPHWQKVCPYPLCPSYRSFGQTVSVVLIGLLAWILVWMVIGEDAEPGGQLFVLTCLTLAAHFGGWILVKATSLPPLIGMLFVGIILKNAGLIHFNEEYKHVCSYLRKIALSIILTRAGLDLDPSAMKKCFMSVIKLGLVPWTFECVLTAIMAHYLLSLPWDWAFLLGTVIAAVSPAVVVSCLLRLRVKGYGVAKGIPTLVLAVSGVDDAASVAIFGIIASVMFSSSSLTLNIIQGPLSIIGGLTFGVVCGYLVKYIPEKNDSFLVPLRVLLLLFGGLFSILGSEEVGWSGAGPLAVIAFAFIACKNWSEQGWEVEDNPVATAFEVFWMFFEPILFGITGAQVVINELEPHLVLIGSGILLTCLVLRVLVTAGSAFGSNLNTKEKFFVGLSWMAKATVQAALAPVALDEIKKFHDHENYEELKTYANVIVTICILSIVITAPLGAIIITFTGPRLLTRTTKPPVLEGWRRSHRPSIRDISIIDEDETAERDAEAVSTSSHPATPTPTPITVQPNHRP